MYIPDPLAPGLQELLKGISLGSKSSNLDGILSNQKIFGVNLYEVGLGKKIETMFQEMIAGPGAVRGTLEKYLT